MTTRINAFPLISHFLGWLFFISLPLIFLLERHHSLSPLITSPAYLLYCSSFIGLFYLFLHLLIPGLYLRKKQTAFFLAILFLLGLFYILKPFDRLIRTSRRLTLPPESAVTLSRSVPSGHETPPPGAPAFDLVSVYLFFFVLALSMAVRIATEWRSSVRRALMAEADKVSAELSLLKAQIHPHFLFNTLNNIYTLILTGHHGAADSILKLSHIMRYITEDASRQFVPLWQEIKFTEDYMALQRLKLGAASELDYHVLGSADQKQIAPLILIPFIENMFKYGVSKHSWSPLLVHIETDGEKLIFRCENNVHDIKSVDRGTGIGIHNTMRRLEALYPGRHHLDIRRTGRYTVTLTLDLRT